MKTKQYSTEIKTRAVELLIESQKDYPSLWAAIQAIAPKFGCTPETLRSWHQKHLAKQNPITVTTESQAARIAELEREIKELKQANEIIRKAAGFFRPGGARPQTEVMVKFIDDEKKKYGVESICRILPIAPSTYYRIKDEQENPEKQSRRKQSDKHLMEQIKQIWRDSGCRYGIRKVWHKLKQDGLPKLARCTVERLMKQLGIQGVWRGKGKITTQQRDDQDKPADLVKRNFTADAPNKLWVADFTYIKTKTGWVYTAFVIDVFKRVIVGWKVSNRMDTQLVLDALNQALDARGRPSGVIHHSDKGSQYLSIKYGERLKQSGLAASVGTTGDSYDNALAESINGLYKTEVIDYFKHEWEGINDVALATLDWVHWYNHERLHSRNGYLSPIDAENIYYCSLKPSGYAA
ncbi:IS3 family transposase [Moraxella osloensis]|uniref:IS3 family transposase n=1 Tax=Faucicola osloensis TaxID=34062 RepID=A0AAW6TGB4_FAUOS|nr:IS3 family transposase [Moraxella osloensis]MDI4509367.1 IS3 family transposase [Moraxella osloensis]